MKIIEYPHAPPEVAKLLEEARRDDLIVRLADGSEFLLVAVEDFDKEIAQSRRNEALMTLLEQRAKESATVSLQEAERQLGLS